MARNLDVLKVQETKRKGGEGVVDEVDESLRKSYMREFIEENIKNTSATST
ncbi:hypothetical protein ACFLV5_05165 [Chloroflexota bacterium]